MGNVWEELGRLLIPGKIGPTFRPLGGGVIADIWLYVILVMLIIIMFQQPEGSTMTTLLSAGAILFILMDKIQAFNQINITPGIHICSVETLLLRCGLLAFPFLIAGATKNEKSRPLCIVAGLLGGAYMFFLWALEMKAAGVCGPD